jgi:hypothetical protein
MACGSSSTSTQSSSSAPRRTTHGVPALGLNAAIPASPTGSTGTVRFTFHATKCGTHVWRCCAPCRSGPDDMAGAMGTPRWMQGTLRVVA